MPNSLTKILQSFRTQSSPNVNDLSVLSEKILIIVVDDAEKLLLAQLQSHLSTDQRGYAIAGLLSALATAITSGFFGLIQSAIPANPTPIVVLLIGIWVAAIFAIASVWPKSFCFPGNEPKNWLPSTWPSQQAKTTKLAHFEQAKILQSQISKNQTIALRKAVLQILSLVLALFSASLFALLSA